MNAADSEADNETDNRKTLEVLKTLTRRLTFEWADARVVLENLSEEERPDIVYLDPMYPHESRAESALPKKAMQIFRRLIGSDSDAKQVFEIARYRAHNRVVVKRPLHADPIAVAPSHVFKGKTARYDMYILPGSK
jgi:16S rRNA (guanine1516-N2)-methyltransferase